MLELKFYEKATVALFLSLLFWLSLYSLSAPEERWPHEKYPERKRQIVVAITGEVENEGRYHFEEGTTLGKALESLTLKESADIDGLKLDQHLKPGQKLRIKKKLKRLKRTRKSTEP